LFQPVFRVLALLAATVAASAHVAAADPVRIVALGDSLTASYGLAPGNGFTERLQAALKARGHDVLIINAGVSGDTASDGLARLDWSVGAGADAVIVELGANDALRGIDTRITRDALDRILAGLSTRKLPVLLAGMRAPPNLGAAYAAGFDAIYPDLAARYRVLFYPFFLDGVATDPALNLGDGIHPNPAGVKVIVERILPTVEKLVEKAGIVAKEPPG